jgi:hypothetical protein
VVNILQIALHYPFGPGERYLFEGHPGRRKERSVATKTFARRGAARHLAMLAGFLLLALYLLSTSLHSARAAGEGTFTIDLTSAYATAPCSGSVPPGQTPGGYYCVAEGTILTVRVNRTPDATLTVPVQVTVRLSGGYNGVDYAPTELSPVPTDPVVLPPVRPLTSVDKVITFPAGTNLSQMETTFQTINRVSTEDSNDPTQNPTNCVFAVPPAPTIPFAAPQPDRLPRSCEIMFVTIIQVSGGALGSPTNVPVIFRGSARPRVTDVSPRSGNPPGLVPGNMAGTTVTITGENFVGSGYRYGPPLPYLAPDPYTPALVAAFNPDLAGNVGSPFHLLWLGPAVAPPNEVACTVNFRFETIPFKPKAGTNPTVLNAPCQRDPIRPNVITAIVPAAPPGLYPVFTDVTVTLKLQVLGAAPPATFLATSARNLPNSQAGLFTIANGPTISGIAVIPPATRPLATPFALNPNSGTYLGGNRITVTGTGFSTGCPTNIYFNGVAGTLCTWIDVNSFSVVVPPSVPSPPITVDVIAVTGLGASPPTAESRYTYTGGPIITSVTPQSGPVSGGTPIVILGSGFKSNNVPATNVLFGGSPPVPALSFIVISDSEIRAVTPSFDVGSGGPGPGTFQITVVHPIAGSSAFTSAANFTYSAGPVITKISPAFGGVNGGTVVTLSGAGFAQGAQVRFGLIPAISVVVDGSIQIRAESPPGVGIVDIVVTLNGLSSPNTPADDFAYTTATLTVLSPNAGPIAGGTTVKLTGKNFTGEAKILVDGLPFTGTFVSATEMTYVMPAATGAKTVQIQVQTLSGTSNALPYYYTSGPIVAAVNPNTGPTTGGTAVIITGTGFLVGATVKFSDTPVDIVNVNSETQITVVAPAAAAAGAADVRITTTAGTSPQTEADKYTYTSLSPKIDSITPNSGSTQGGYTVTLTGAGFTGTVCPGSVKFGFQIVQACTVANDTSLTVTVPINVAGPTFVTIVTANGTSQIIQNFTYIKSTQPGGSTVPNPNGETSITYRLNFRWTLITYLGPNGLDVPTALRGAPGTTEVTGLIAVLYTWENENQKWLAYFVQGAGVPGANDFATLTNGTVYWVAIFGPADVVWTIQIG